MGEATSGERRVAEHNELVNVMDDRAQKIFDEAFATLDRVAHVTVEHRAHRDDGLLTQHSVNMPEPSSPPLPSRTLTDYEIARMIADAVAAQPRALTSGEIEALIDRRVNVLSDATGDALSEVRKQLRGEIAKATNRPAEEFFYLDDDGKKCDADLHNAILGPVDHPIDEKIMGPIRERNRAKWLAEQAARRERGGVVEVPQFLPRRRHG